MEKKFNQIEVENAINNLEKTIKDNKAKMATLTDQQEIEIYEKFIKEQEEKLAKYQEEKNNIEAGSYNNVAKENAIKVLKKTIEDAKIKMATLTDQKEIEKYEKFIKEQEEKLAKYQGERENTGTENSNETIKNNDLKNKSEYDWGDLTEEQIDELWEQGITPDSQEYRQAFGNFVKIPNVTEVSDIQPELEPEPEPTLEPISEPPIPKESRLQKIVSGIGNFFDKIKNFGPIKFIGKHLARFGRFIARKVREMQQEVTAHDNDYEQNIVEEENDSKTGFEQVRDLLGDTKESPVSQERTAPAVEKQPQEEVVNGDYSDIKRAKRNDSAKDAINNGKMPTRPLMDEVGPYVEDNGKRVYLNNEDGSEKPLEEVKRELSETVREIMGEKSNSWEVSDEVKAGVVEVGKSADSSSEKTAPAKDGEEMEV